MSAALLTAALIQLPGEALPPLPQTLAKVTPGVLFEDTPVRRALRRVAASNDAAIVFARGLDPTTPVALDLTNATVGEALAEIAGQGGAGAVALGGAVFVAPPSVCTAALELTEARRKELRPARGVRRATRERALREQNVTWDDLTPPRAILDDLAGRFVLTVENADAIPHDLWPAGRLPTADAPAALGAVLAPCELTFVWSDDRTSIRIEPAPVRAVAQPPDLTTFAARTAVGDGGGTPLDRQRFTLSAEEVTVRQVMNAVKGVRFEFNPRTLIAGGGDLDARVTIDAENADADEFFTALFTPAGIAYEYEGTTVILTPASADGGD